VKDARAPVLRVRTLGVYRVASPATGSLTNQRPIPMVMAIRKKRSRPASPSQPEPFNNPFGEQSRKLKRAVRDARDRAVASAPQPPPAVEPEKDRSQEEVFRDAVHGVRPLSAKGSARVRGAGATPAQTPAAARVGGVVDPSAEEHFDIRFSDQFIRGRGAGVSRETMSKLERGEFAVRSHVDLHGMPLDDARLEVDRFLAERQRHGDRCVLLITGKGRNSPRQQGVLREGIPQWLARGPSSRRVLAFVTARPCDGGEGALYVLLRKNASRKNRIDVESGGGI